MKRFLAAALLPAVSAPAAYAGPVNLASPGLVPVTVTDPGATIAGVPPERAGLDEGEVIAHYDKQKLMRAGALHEDTTRLVASDGSVEPVEPNVVLEVKLADRSRLRGDLDPLVVGVDLDELDARARAQTGKPIPDLGAWHQLRLPAGTDPDATITDLLASGQVTEAYVAPDAAPPPQQTNPTPDFTALQGYNRPAPAGVDADFSLQDPRTRGAGVTIADLEYYWTAEHEDLQLDPIATDLGKTTYVQYRNFADEHGTAVFGEMVAKDNGFGVTGGVPDATMRGISPQRNNNGRLQYSVSGALTYVAQFLKAGDVVLIEQQTVGPAGGTAYVPVEWNQANFDAIKALSNLGIVVMETGGNGGQDLDGANMLGRFDRSVRDSGAIIGGAGSSTTRAALNFSSHGTRVDLQGWGQNITTTGSGGNLFGGTAPEMLTRRYTRSFSGTSGAGPIVVNAIVAVQSYLKATAQAPYTSAQLRDLLRRTGTPQTGTRLVGPLPDIRAALREIEVDAPNVTASFTPAAVNGWHHNPTVTLTADDGWGVGVEANSIEYRLDGGAWTPYTAPFQVLEPNGHTLELRATDLRGNTKVHTTTFNVYDLETPVDSTVGGTVAPTLALTLGDSARFEPFVPGVPNVYTAQTTANVISTAGSAELTVSDPGHLANGPFQLPQPLQVELTPAAWTGPVSNAATTIAFKQAIGAGDALCTGSYSRTLTFTLSTSTP
ncbi:S8 family serine peptidase [Solirubrobacter sp. CPCC 204708]|uniref:S8 family serine peptidase n=1 Tax=Solirubrobacter deserti TaxID=2282478 RepID=A0ABT4RP71_9ACTN|nr:S8 family serine peptidase [Solirubrobacter deserti]MBE2317512.1 S8 family serine peptidase [Solirubrobacter deserti]MDA0140312.1 S8 family serine peptidase [Solirubrobacter deserti]